MVSGRHAPVIRIEDRNYSLALGTYAYAPPVDRNNPRKSPHDQDCPPLSVQNILLKVWIHEDHMFACGGLGPIILRREGGNIFSFPPPFFRIRMSRLSDPAMVSPLCWRLWAHLDKGRPSYIPAYRQVEPVGNNDKENEGSALTVHAYGQIHVHTFSDFDQTM